MHITNLVLLALVGFFAGSVKAEPAKEKSATDRLVEKIHAALKKANPDYSGKGKFMFRNGKLHTVSLMRCKGLHDISPLSKFPIESVTNVVLYNAVNITGLVAFKKCRLVSLNTERCGKLSDLSPLEGMPLRGFRMYACKGIKDLSPLKGMPLKHLDIGLNPLVDDISPLAGMPLVDLRIDNCPKLTDISVIKGMKLKFLSVFENKGVKDFSPILGLPLETLFFSPSLLSNEVLKGVREMKTLKIIGTGWADYGKKQTPEKFWERFDK
ncbi:MAG: hypothetical protein QGF00_34655, partial [Planctomycetota bacterium]|nr:hypothetical protein [Planctomycetota bacterium]